MTYTDNNPRTIWRIIIIRPFCENWGFFFSWFSHDICQSYFIRWIFLPHIWDYELVLVTQKKGPKEPWCQHSSFGIWSVQRYWFLTELRHLLFFQNGSPFFVSRPTGPRTRFFGFSMKLTFIFKFISTYVIYCSLDPFTQELSKTH